MDEPKLSTAAIVASRLIHYTVISSTNAFNRSQCEQRRIARQIDEVLQPERQALCKALDLLERHRSQYLSAGETMATHMNKLIVDTNAAIEAIKTALQD